MKVLPNSGGIAKFELQKCIRNNGSCVSEKVKAGFMLCFAGLIGHL